MNSSLFVIEIYALTLCNVIFYNIKFVISFSSKKKKVHTLTSLISRFTLSNDKKIFTYPKYEMSTSNIFHFVAFLCLLKIIYMFDVNLHHFYANPQSLFTQLNWMNPLSIINKIVHSAIPFLLHLIIYIW